MNPDMQWDEAGKCYVADSKLFLTQGWSCIHIEDFKPGVILYHVVRGDEFRIVYVKSEAKEEK